MNDTYRKNWTGLCAPVRLQHRVTLLRFAHGHNRTRRAKRATWTDEVPKEHQLRSHWSRFWESFISLYGVADLMAEQDILHYRLASFANSTTAAIAGIKQELTALRLMTTQNRMALDMILAEKGGVCAMVGDQCCTYVPANDEGTGSIATAVQGMNKVSKQLREDELKDSSKNWNWGILSSLFGVFAPYV